MRRPLSPLVLVFLAGILSGCDEGPLADENRFPLNQDSLDAIAGKNKDRAIDAKEAGSAGATLEKWLADKFGSPAAPNVSAAPFLNAAVVKHGRDVYVRNCMHCHGYYGRGDGPTAPFLNPRPRDFSRKGYVKFKSTKADLQYPSLKDLERTLTYGVQQTAMPAFGYPYGPINMHVDETGADKPGYGIDAAAQYVTYLMMRATLEDRLVDEWVNQGKPNQQTVDDKLKEVTDDWKAAQDPANQVNPPAAPPTWTPQTYAKALERGKEIFLSGSAQCSACHGVEGKGDGPSMNDPKNNHDDWGNDLKARDLTRGIYRGGRRPVDLYRRVRVGIKGTPMPGFGEATISEDDAWKLIEFVRSLAFENKPEVAMGTPTSTPPGSGGEHK